MQDIAVIIVNHNTRDLLRDCLNSALASVGDVGFDLFVVDNSSSDGSAEMVRAEFPQVQVIENENKGFAHANNLVLRRLEARYALLLNPDTVLPDTALADSVAFMDAYPDTGVMSAKLVRADGSLDKACRRSFPTPWVAFGKLFGLSRLFPNAPALNQYNLDGMDPDQLTEVDAVAGAFMMMRREALDQAGLLDESFFAFGEDLDLCYRIKIEHGWKVYYNPAIVVLHYKGEAMRQRSYAMTVQFYRAMWIFYRKHYAREHFFLFNWLVVAGIGAFCAVALVKNLVSPAKRKKAGL
jgi:N-acetylglucosaminyl-diphospho-decaprenol L-rhamnosyltransferase